jgi:hypothetical protein
LEEVHGTPFAPTAVTVTVVGCAVGLAYTQYLMSPGTPPTGFSFESEMNEYVVVFPTFEKLAATLLVWRKFPSELRLGQAEDAFVSRATPLSLSNPVAAGSC